MDRKQLGTLLIVICAFIAIGVIGYMFIEEWNLSDALYMTVITLTTTGFKEVHDLSLQGQYFTMVFLIVGVGVVAYAGTAIMGELILANIQNKGKNKMEKKISELSNHTIICGFGRMGKITAEELFKAKESFVVLEKDPKLTEDLQASDYLWLDGDAADDDKLIKAGIKRAKVLASMVDNDADALYLVMAAKTINPNIRIITRANHEAAKKKLLLAGAHMVVLPLVMSGVKIAQSIITPTPNAMIDLSGITVNGDETLQLFDIEVDSHTKLLDHSLKTCGVKRNGLIVVGVRKRDRQMNFAPAADYKFQEGDVIIAIGTKTSFENSIKALQK